MINQAPSNINIQVSEVSDQPIADLNKKIQTHIAFISEDPQKVINVIKEWANKKGFSFREGKWSDTELYFDLPDLFVNFAIEVMHTSVLNS